MQITGSEGTAHTGHIRTLQVKYITQIQRMTQEEPTDKVTGFQSSGTFEEADGGGLRLRVLRSQWEGRMRRGVHYWCPPD